MVACLCVYTRDPRASKCPGVEFMLISLFGDPILNSLNSDAMSKASLFISPCPTAFVPADSFTSP